MPAQIFDLNDESIIEINSGWTLDLFFPEDVDTAAFRGQIRRAIGAEVLANFRFTNFPFDEEAGTTKIVMSLTSGETRRIPAPPPGEFYVYDVVMNRQGRDRQRVLQGKVFLSPGVTD